MEISPMNSTAKKIAVVTGANKGIGLEICSQLISEGVKVVLTARDEARGAAALEKLRASAPTDVVFHRLDVTDSASASDLSDFVKNQFGKLDILVNNAGILWRTSNSYQTAVDCLNTNYYGAKTVTEALLPLLLLSDSPRIVNVSSSYGKLQNIPNKELQREFNNTETLTEDTLDELVQSFLKDFENGKLNEKGWPNYLSAYIVSKVALNAYTRLLAKKYPAICSSCVSPGYVKTDMNDNAGIFSVQDGARGPVMAALLPHGSPSGTFYDQTRVTSYIIAAVTGANKGIGLEICRQLLGKGVKVVLTARDETRGKAAAKKLQAEEGKDVIFHQLDVADSTSVASFKIFVQTQFGRLDILINNAGVSGVELDPEVFTSPSPPINLRSVPSEIIQTYENGKVCIDINYFGTKTICDVFIPLLELSNSPRIVNLTSNLGLLRHIPSEEIRKEIANVDNLTEERLDELVNSFLNDLKSGERFKESCWPTHLSAYTVSKVILSAYTRILARKHPKICINCVHPGFVKTDMSWNMGPDPVEEGAEGPVMVALLPDGSPSGQFYAQTELSSFE